MTEKTTSPEINSDASHTSDRKQSLGQALTMMQEITSTKECANKQRQPAKKDQVISNIPLLAGGL